MSQTKTIEDNNTGELIEQRTIGETAPFMMVFKDNWQAFIECQKKDPLAAVLMSTLMQHMNRENALIVSRECLAELLDVSTKTIDRKVKFLRDNKFIHVLRTGGSNVYLINANVVWTTHANQLKYARFRADVILSEREQDAITLAHHNLKQIDVKPPKANKDQR